MPETIMRVGWAAGRFNADPHEVAAYLAENVRRHRLDLLLTSESQQAGIDAIVQQALGTAFGVEKRGEYMAIWRRTEFEQREQSSMWHLSAVARLIEWREMRAGVFKLWSPRLGIPVNAIGSHPPAGVQDGDGWNEDNPLQVRATRQGHDRLGKKINRARRRRPWLLQIVCEDSNLDQRRRRFRRWLRKRLRAASIWAGRVPKRGSHGRRLIDTITVLGGTALKVTVVESHVSDVRKPLGYDHDAVWAAIKVRRTA